MPARKRPHPRSLDALFPRPKIKRCGRGHSQTPTWRATQGCSTCQKIDDYRVADTIRISTDSGAEERKAWERALGPPPAELVMRCGDGQVLRLRIPPHARKRRGPQRRRRI